MSFSNFNNSEPQGSQLQNCSAGTPIGGVDSSNIFRLLKLTAAGGITQGVPAAESAVNYFGVNPAAGVMTGIPGAKAANIIVGYLPVVTTAISAGVYSILPAFSDVQNAGGAVSLILVKDGSLLAAYCGGLGIGTDGFAPNTAQIAQGFYGMWQDVAMTTFSGGVSVAYDNTFIPVDTYLAAGTYSLAVVVHTAITTTSPTYYCGLQTFTQLA